MPRVADPLAEALHFLRIDGTICCRSEFTAPWAAAMSRPSFAERFAELVGEPAMHYVTRWKMYTALTWQKEGNRPVGELSHQLGYESEAAFSRAFKPFIGIPPGAARKNSDSGPLEQMMELNQLGTP